MLRAARRAIRRAKERIRNRRRVAAALSLDEHIRHDIGLPDRGLCCGPADPLI